MPTTDSDNPDFKLPERYPLRKQALGEIAFFALMSVAFVIGAPNLGGLFTGTLFLAFGCLLSGKKLFSDGTDNLSGEERRWRIESLAIYSLTARRVLTDAEANRLRSAVLDQMCADADPADDSDD